MNIHAISMVQLHEVKSYHLSIAETKDEIMIIPITRESFIRILNKYKHKILETKRNAIEGAGADGKMTKHFFNNIVI